MSIAANPYASPQTTDLATGGSKAPVEPKIFAFSGRLGRMRAWTYPFLASLLSMLLLIPAVALFSSANFTLGALLYIAAVLLSSVYSTSVYVRRLHDLNKSGWWLLLMLVPLVNVGLLLYLLFARGNADSNQYGPPATPNSTGVVVGFVVGLFFVVLGPLAAISIPAYQDYVERAQQSQ